MNITLACIHLALPLSCTKYSFIVATCCLTTNRYPVAMYLWSMSRVGNGTTPLYRRGYAYNISYI